MNIEDLKTGLSIYQKAVSNANSYRKEWKAGTKNLVFDTLTKIVQITGMGAEVRKEEKLDGMEMVFLVFKKRESGIFEHFEDTVRPYMKEGGYLFYTQIYNGKISIFISLPVIENFIERTKPKPVGIFEPAELTEEIIIDHVSQFLKEMASWEDNDLQHQEIGYKMRS
jgi:hypothetical protein